MVLLRTHSGSLELGSPHCLRVTTQARGTTVDKQQEKCASQGRDKGSGMRWARAQIVRWASFTIC